MLRELNINEIDAVAGGMINNGQGQFVDRAPGALPPRGNGGPPHGTNLAPTEALMAAGLLLAIVL
jgi:hypothetical protein